MTAPNCSRSWLVDAVRDGRVTGDEQTSFERHLVECSECSERSRRMHVCLNELKQLPSGLPDTFTLRRKRRELLRAFDATLLATSNRSVARRFRLIAVFAAVSLAAFAGLLRSRLQERRGHWIDVTASAGASWSEQRSNQIDRIALRSGRFQLNIHRPSPDSQVTITLPDGEIQDVGTELAVWIDDSRTNHVSVERGNVIVRMAGLPEMKLGAGEHWDRPIEARTDAPAVPERAAPPNGDHLPTTPRKHRLQAPRTVRAEPSSGPEPSTNHGTAAETASEDAAYLKALRLFEAGQREQAVEAAEEYLKRYPRGFRRLEACTIARRVQMKP